MIYLDIDHMFKNCARTVWDSVHILFPSPSNSDYSFQEWIDHIRIIKQSTTKFSRKLLKKSSLLPGLFGIEKIVIFGSQSCHPAYILKTLWELLDSLFGHQDNLSKLLIHVSTHGHRNDKQTIFKWIPPLSGWYEMVF